jgi:hypothetical protein
MQHLGGRDAADPHHGGRGVADDAARAAGVRRRDDRGEVADTHAPAKQRVRHGAADQRGGDVVQEAGDYEHDCEERERAHPSVR